MDKEHKININPSSTNKAQPTRHPIVAILFQIGIRLRFLLESWMGFKLFFCGLAGYPSPYRPANCPKYDLLTQGGFALVWIFTGLARETGIPYLLLAKTGLIHLVIGFHDFLCNRLMNQLKASNYTTAQRNIPIPEYDWETGSPEEFYQIFVKRPHPVVLRGFMRKTSLVTRLTWQNILTQFGNEDVFLTKKELDGFPGKLKEVDNPKVYLHNSEVLFQKYPEIRDLFQYERLEPYMHMKVGYEQIFVGRAGTGSPFHHAAVYNMFYQVHGKKQWYFIDPYDTFLAYPLSVVGMAANALMVLWPDQYNKKAFPLFQYCPVYGTVLDEGDVLFNPPYWWHSIRNVTETTVGVASRWHTDGIAGHYLTMTEEDYDIYRLASLSFFAGLRSFPFLHGILQTPSPRFDEHNTLRETKNRYVHKQLEFDEAGGLAALGVVTRF